MFRSKVPHWLTLKVKRTIYLIVVFSTPRAAERRFMGDFFMKEKIFAVITALIVLMLTTGIWFSYKGKITFSTDLKLGTEAVLQYREKADGGLISVNKKAGPDGKISFKVKGKTLSYFKINIPEKTAVKNVRFRGWKKQNITLNAQNEYTDKILNNSVVIDYHNLIVLSCLGYYFGWFLIRSLKYGFPKDDPKLPKMMNLEFLRIVFTLSVVCCHFIGNLKIWNSAWISVEFFFILSGFLLIDTFNPERTVQNFLKSKIVHFLPLLFFASVVESLFRHDITRMISDYFFLPTIKFGDFIGSAWYIKILFWVLLLYFYLIKSFKRQIVNLTIGIITFFSYVAIVSRGTGREAWFYYDPVNNFIFVNILRALGGIGLGYFLKQLIDISEIKPGRLYDFFEFFIFVYAIFSMYVKKIEPENSFNHVIAFFLLIFCFIQKKGIISQFFEKRIFAVLAKYCLSIYLMHGCIVFYLFPYFFQKYPNILMEYKGFTVFITLFLVCLSGVIVHHAVELPAARALKKLLK